MVSDLVASFKEIIINDMNRLLENLDFKNLDKEKEFN